MSPSRIQPGFSRIPAKSDTATRTRPDIQTLYCVIQNVQIKSPIAYVRLKVGDSNRTGHLSTKIWNEGPLVRCDHNVKDCFN